MDRKIAIQTLKDEVSNFNTENTRNLDVNGEIIGYVNTLLDNKLNITYQSLLYRDFAMYIAGAAHTAHLATLTEMLATDSIIQLSLNDLNDLCVYLLRKM